MAIININNLKDNLSKKAANAGKNAINIASNIGDSISNTASNIADSSTELATNLIIKLLKKVDLNSVVRAAEEYNQKTGKDITSTINFINKLKSLQDGK